MSEALVPYVFLSYASVERERALAIADTLEGAGVPVWLDRRSIAGGSRWNTGIVQGIKGCAVLALAATPAAVASRHVQRELQLAVEFDRPVLPLLLEPVQFPDALRYALAGVQWVDLLDRPANQWLPDILRALAGLGVTRSTDAAIRYASSVPNGSTGPGMAAPRTNLPAALTSFVGRQQEIADVTHILETARLVTLTGPGGTGKTRLALALAEQVLSEYPDGVWFVDLSPLVGPALVVSSIAQTLGVRESEGRSLGEALTASLREKRTLLVLDNFEQVVEAAPLLRDLLAGAHGLTLLVTSRVVLHVTGEHEYAVPPLPLPDAEAGPSQDALARNPAVALFVERARGVKREFTPTQENATAVVEICTRLDGLPLAIELAASRIRLLSPDAIRARLVERLKLLTGGARDLPARQQTLHGTIRWSYDLLD